MSSSQSLESLSISEIKAVQTYFKQAETYKTQGEWQQAIACYREAIAINPKSVTAYQQWGEALLSLEQWEEAIDIYHRSLKINPDFDWSYYNLGEALSQLERWEEAIIAYQQGLDLNPNLPSIYKKLANTFYQRAVVDRESILDYYRNLIKVNPEEVSFYHQALELQPQDAQLYLGLGNALVVNNKLDQAIVAYQMALQLQPDNRRAKIELNKLLEPENIEHLSEHLAEESTSDFSHTPESKLQQAKQIQGNLNQIALETFLLSGAKLNFPVVENPQVSIILILYNRAELTLSCLYSILHNNYKSVEVVIVDNCSTDQTRQLLNKITGAKIILNESNRHFLLAANQASKVATGKHLLFLNNDAQILGDSINIAVNTIESAPDIGAVGGKIILPDGSLQEAGSIIWQDGSCLGYGRGDNPTAPQYMFQRPVDYCSGAFLLTSRELFTELGAFDEAYQPAYYEETDYCVRVQKEGYKVVYDPNVVILHYEFASSSSSDNAMRRSARALPIALQQRNQQIFVAQHGDWLKSQYTANVQNILFSRIASQDKRQRILLIDDRIPHPYLGSGYTRSYGILQRMVELGYFVTCYPTDLSYSEDWQDIYVDLDRRIEIARGYGLDGLEAFLCDRQGYYHTIFVSRPHNMNHLDYILSKADILGETKIIYDAEALYSLREFAYQKLTGTEVSGEEQQQAIARELDLAEKSDLIISVSELEKQRFVDYGYEHVEVLGHALAVSPISKSFESRKHILFVGSVYGLESPNADSILWLGKEIFPLIQEKLGNKVKLIVVGSNTADELQQQIADLNNPAIAMLGKVDDLSTFYERSRIFVAPTRFAAGIPHKVHEAAAKGLPVVTTSLIAAQLEWENEIELLSADNASDFAQQCVRLYQQAELWQKLRDNGLKRIEEQCSPQQFTHKLKLILETSPQGAKL
jgi:O-antigen biosynthesis protein